MEMFIQQLEDCKHCIPDFAIKLYYMLEKPQYNDFISWANEGTEVLIKNPKKVQDKVLPYFFRHRHLSSFIRQLNMYKFNKVHKISKERNHIYFKNQFFRRGEFEMIKNVKRNQKEKKIDQLSSVSIQFSSNQNRNTEPTCNSELEDYKQKVDRDFMEISAILERVMKSNPETKADLSVASEICKNRLIGTLQEGEKLNTLELDIFGELEQKKSKENLMGQTQREFSSVYPFYFPSINSFSNLQG